MRVFGLLVAVVLVGCSGSGPGEETATDTGFKESPQQHAMPKTLLVTKRTPIEKARFPAIDFHFHGGGLREARRRDGRGRRCDDLEHGRRVA